MSARFSLKITTLCHSVRSRGSPDWRSFQRSEVAIRRLTIFWSLWLWRTSGSRPRLPTRITLFTLPAIACPPPPREASPDPACPSRRWAREPPLPVKRGRAYQELLASNSECRRPLRLPREGRRQGQAGGERGPDGAEAGRRHSAGRTAVSRTPRSSIRRRTRRPDGTCSRCRGRRRRTRWRGLYGRVVRGVAERCKDALVAGSDGGAHSRLTERGSVDPIFCQTIHTAHTGPFRARNDTRAVRP